jgi:hypothetical protein
MNKLLIIIIAITLFSCGKKEKTPQEKQAKITKEVKEELNYNFDKIILLANIESLPKSKVHKVMQGYFKVMYNDDIAFEKDEDYQDMINTISENTGLSAKKVSSIIFAYVYEMRTKEEIGDEYIDKLEEEQEQYNEVYDPR